MSYSWHKPAWDALLERREDLPHALLFRGSQGIGKLAFAEALARALLCEEPGRKDSACGRCRACGWMEQGSHPDFRRLEPESLSEQSEGEQGGEKRASAQIQVEQIRRIPEFINVSSHRGGVKVVLIHPAESLNVHAANALLKSLEEPPPRTYFLLVAHRWHQLLPTIRSRCRHVPLLPPSIEAARGWLKEQGLGDPELALAQAGGAPLLALGFDEDYWRARERFLGGIAAGEFDALGLAEQSRDHPPALVVGWLQRWSYDLVCHKISGRVRYNPDLAVAISAAAGRVDMLDAVRFLRQMVRLQRVVSHPLNTRLFFEQLLLTYAALLRQRPLEFAA